jgi:Histidine kinase
MSISTSNHRDTMFAKAIFNRDDVQYHVVFWIILYFLHFMNLCLTYDKRPAAEYINSFIVLNLLYVSSLPIAYFHTYWLVPRTLGNQKWSFSQALIYYSIVTIALMMFGGWLSAFIYDWKWFWEMHPINSGYYFDTLQEKNPTLYTALNQHFDDNQKQALVQLFGSPSSVAWTRNLPETVFNTFLLMGLVYIRKWYHNSEALRLHNLILEKDREIVQKGIERDGYKIKALNWQMQPHFLFNALNTIYIKTLRNPSAASDAVLQLNETLRYIVYDCNRNRVPLSNEVQFIHNYLDVSLQGLSPDKYKKTLNIGEIPEDAEILPLILITFVENAVKHGIQETDGNRWLTIDLKVENNVLTLVIANSQAIEPVSKSANSSGIGIANTRRRLKTAYPNRHQLILNSNDEVFETTLIIDL